MLEYDCNLKAIINLLCERHSSESVRLFYIYPFASLTLQFNLSMSMISAPQSPPYQGCQGKWVRSIEFLGNQSFGFYRCNFCDKEWQSARAKKGFKQGCKQCQKQFYPAYMWQNEGYTERSYGNRKDDDAHHMSQLCQACRLGICQQNGSRLLKTNFNFKGFFGNFRRRY